MHRSLVISACLACAPLAACGSDSAPGGTRTGSQGGSAAQEGGLGGGPSGGRGGTSTGGAPSDAGACTSVTTTGLGCALYVMNGVTLNSQSFGRGMLLRFHSAICAREFWVSILLFHSCLPLLGIAG